MRVGSPTRGAHPLVFAGPTTAWCPPRSHAQEDACCRLADRGAFASPRLAHQVRSRVANLSSLELARVGRWCIFSADKRPRCSLASSRGGSPISHGSRCAYTRGNAFFSGFLLPSFPAESLNCIRCVSGLSVLSGAVDAVLIAGSNLQPIWRCGLVFLLCQWRSCASATSIHSLAPA